MKCDPAGIKEESGLKNEYLKGQISAVHLNLSKKHLTSLQDLIPSM